MNKEGIQAEIHRRIAPLFSKREQGLVMNEVRAVLDEFACMEQVGWMYRSVKPDRNSVCVIGKRAEAPEGGWVDYEEIALYAESHMPKEK